MNIVYQNQDYFKKLFIGRTNEMSVFPEFYDDCIMFIKHFDYISIDIEIFDGLIMDEVSWVFNQILPDNIMELDSHFRQQIRELKLNKIIDV